MSVPVFQFQNDWRDLKYQPVSSGDSSNSSSSSGGGSGGPVVSGYLWIYLGTSLGITLIPSSGGGALQRLSGMRLPLGALSLSQAFWHGQARKNR